MDAHLQQFLDDEFFSLVLQATNQHSRTYKRKTSSVTKTEFARGLRSRIEAIGRRYAERGTANISSEDHVAEIERLADSMSDEFAAYLEGGEFRIGSGQKALNLYLKYLWGRGLLGVPPHCPFDGFVIKKLGLQKEIQWTTLRKVDAYRGLVKLAMTVARADGFDNIAQWELQIYNEHRRKIAERKSEAGTRKLVRHKK